MKFRKKPVVIEAEQYNGPESVTTDAAPHPFHGWLDWHVIGEGLGLKKAPFIETLEGRMRVSPGDWIIRGVKGELYPCKPDIFDATYEPVDPTDRPKEDRP